MTETSTSARTLAAIGEDGPGAVRVLTGLLMARCNVVISGGMSAGKATLLRRLARAAEIEPLRPGEAPTYGRPAIVDDDLFYARGRPAPSTNFWKTLLERDLAFATTAFAASIDEAERMMLDRFCTHRSVVSRDEHARRLRDRTVFVHMERAADGRRIIADLRLPPFLDGEEASAADEAREGRHALALALIDIGHRLLERSIAENAMPTPA